MRWLFVVLAVLGTMMSSVVVSAKVDAWAPVAASVTPSPRFAAATRPPAQEEPPILMAKRGLKLKDLRSARLPTKKEMARLLVRLRSGEFREFLLILLPMLGLVIFGFSGLRRLLRFLYRGLFLNTYRGLVVDSRITDRGRYRPIVAFEHKTGVVLRVLAPFEVRRDPDGRELPVEVIGNRAQVVKRSRGFIGGPLSFGLPLLLAYVCLLILTNTIADVQG